MWSKLHRIYSVDPILFKSSHLKPLSPLEVLGEFAKNRFGKYFPVAVYCNFVDLSRGQSKSKNFQSKGGSINTYTKKYNPQSLKECKE